MNSHDEYDAYGEESPSAFAIDPAQLAPLLELLDQAMDVTDLGEGSAFADLFKAHWALKQLPEIPPWGSQVEITIGASHSLGDSAGVTNEWVGVELNSSALRFTAGEHFYEPNYGGDTSVQEVFTCDANGFNEGDLEEWLERLEVFSSEELQVSASGFNAPWRAFLGEVEKAAARQRMSVDVVKAPWSADEKRQAELEKGLRELVDRRRAARSQAEPPCAIGAIFAMFSGVFWLASSGPACLLAAGPVAIAAISAYAPLRRLFTIDLQIQGWLGRLAERGCSVEWIGKRPWDRAIVSEPGPEPVSILECMRRRR